MTEHHDRHTMERMREPAVWRLSDKGALVPDREANERLTNTVGAQDHDFTFKTTRRAARERDGRGWRELPPGARPLSEYVVQFCLRRCTWSRRYGTMKRKVDN